LNARSETRGPEQLLRRGRIVAQVRNHVFRCREKTIATKFEKTHLLFLIIAGTTHDCANAALGQHVGKQLNALDQSIYQLNSSQHATLKHLQFQGQLLCRSHTLCN